MMEGNFESTIENASMTRLFLRGMVWVVYPLMALMVGALAVGARSGSPLIAYLWYPPESSTMILNLHDLRHDRTITIDRDRMFLFEYDWIDSNTLFYYQVYTALYPDEPLVQRSYDYRLYNPSGGGISIDFFNDVGASAVWFSPDGQQVAYVVDGILYVRDLGNGQIQTINDEDETHQFELAWASDNCQIAYAPYNPNIRTETVHSQIWIYDVCELRQSLILEDFQFINFTHLAWSFSGDYLSVIEHEELYLSPILRIIDIKANNTDIPELSSNQAFWSPVSNQIAFSVYDEQRQSTSVHVANLDANSVTQLPNYGGSDRVVAWSPDGTQIAIFSPTPLEQLYLVDINGSNVQQISGIYGYVVSAQWQPLP